MSRWAASGSEALVALGRHPPPDLLLLDLRLREIDGFEVLRWMRARGLTVPTVAMTGHVLEFSADEARALGAIDYLRKPVFVDELLPYVQRRLRLGVDSTLPLHASVVAGEPAAIERAADALLAGVRRRLASRFTHADPQRVAQAVEDAILDYTRNPAQFDPGRGSSLAAFIYMVAWRNLANLEQSERQRKRREARYVRLQPAPAVDASAEISEHRRQVRTIVASGSSGSRIAGCVRRCWRGWKGTARSDRSEPCRRWRT